MTKHYESNYETAKEFAKRQNLPVLEDFSTKKQLKYAEANRARRLCEAYHFIVRDSYHRADNQLLIAFQKMTANRSAKGWAASGRTTGVQMLLSYVDIEFPEEDMLSTITTLLD